jgi:uncharacterized membrane protein
VILNNDAPRLSGAKMHSTIQAIPLFAFELPCIVLWTWGAAIALLVIGGVAARSAVAGARGLEKIVALRYLLFAMPLAVFGAEHLCSGKGMVEMVPAYMPWRLFWIYFIGIALVAASLSIATRIQVRWSGLLFGVMMFLFVAMLHFPGALAEKHNRILWTIVFRESSFGGGAWMVAASAMPGWSDRVNRILATVGRVVIALAAVFFSFEQFLHPANVPGVPLEKLMPTWIPGHAVIAYLTGAILLVCGVSILANKKTRTMATYLGTWIVLLVVFIYVPILIASVLDPSVGARVEGINYFADTMLFAGAILALAGDDKVH